MEHCNKKPRPPLFPDEQLAEWRREPVTFMCSDGESITISARVYSKQPSAEQLIHQRILELNKIIFDTDMQGRYNCLTEILREEVEFLKLLI